MCDVAGAAGLKSDATIKFRTTQRTWRDTAARDNQIEDDVEDVERYCGNCASRKARAGGDTPAPRAPFPSRTHQMCPLQLQPLSHQCWCQGKT